MTINFLSELKKNGVLTTGTKDGNDYLHLAAPCKIEISESVSQKLKDNYESDKEKGVFSLQIHLEKVKKPTY